MEVPSEILDLICEQLRTTDLKSLRLTCKAFDQATTPLIFDQVILSPSFYVLDIAKLVVARFGSLLRTMIIYPLIYRNLTSTDFESDVSNMMRRIDSRYGGLGNHAYRDAFWSHTELWYHSYETRRREQQSLFETGDFDVHLRSALSNGLNLKRVVLSQPPMTGMGLAAEASRVLGIRRHNLCEKTEHCPLDEQEHFIAQPLAHDCRTGSATDSLSTIMVALDLT